MGWQTLGNTYHPAEQPGWGVAGIWPVVQDQVVAVAVPWIINADEIEVHCDDPSLGRSNDPLTVCAVGVSCWVAGTSK